MTGGGKQVKERARARERERERERQMEKAGNDVFGN